jgi:hypothetical protein
MVIQADQLLWTTQMFKTSTIQFKYQTQHKSRTQKFFWYLVLKYKDFGKQTGYRPNKSFSNMINFSFSKKKTLKQMVVGEVWPNRRITGHSMSDASSPSRVSKARIWLRSHLTKQCLRREGSRTHPARRPSLPVRLLYRRLTKLSPFELQCKSKLVAFFPCCADYN